MKTIHTDVYAFDELNDDAKEKARDWWREVNAGDSYWSECVIDDAKECLKFLGWDIGTARGRRSTPAIYFSGFSSQGDGACFEGSWRAADVNADGLKDHAPLDKELHRIADEMAAIAKDWPDAACSVKHSGHYSHENCTVFADFESNDEAADDLIWGSPEYKTHCAKIKESEDALIEASRDFMRWIYRALECEYEYQNSDECVDETIRANEYTFTESGKRFG